MLDNAGMRARNAVRIDPIAKALLKAKITPDQVTVFGSVVAVAICLGYLAKGQFLVGGILLSLIGVSDLLDGTMARISGTSSSWGAFLDSTLDRVVDGAIYGSLIYWYASNSTENRNLLISLIIGLVAAQITSYTRARWESVGVSGKVGIIERAERMIIICTSLIISGLGLNLMPLAIYALAITSTFTVLQRIMFVRKQLL